MLVQLTISCCAPSPATFEIRMRSGFSCVAEKGLIWSLVGELDQRHVGDARPSPLAAGARFVPAPLDPRVAGVDREDHAALSQDASAARTSRATAPITALREAGRRSTSSS